MVTMEKLRTPGGVDTDVNVVWTGRLKAVIGRWRSHLAPWLEGYTVSMWTAVPLGWGAHSRVRELLFEAREDLRLATGRGGTLIEKGGRFDYFAVITDIIKGARTDLFIIDAYLDGEFVKRYLPAVAEGCAVRLLTAPGTKWLASLVPAVEMFVQQHQTKVEIRVATGLHERYLIVDSAATHLSGASLKDGALNANTIVQPLAGATHTLLRDAHEATWRKAGKPR